MRTLIADGGPPVWVILLFDLLLLVDAILLVRQPDDRKLAFLRAMTLAQVFAMVAAFTAGVARSVDACSRLMPQLKDRWPLLVTKGTAESMANVILGTAPLALAWFLAAIAARRRVPAA